MTKHKATGGTVRPPKPMTSADAAKHLSPGPKVPGFRPPRKSGENIFNDNSLGRRAWDKTTKGL